MTKLAHRTSLKALLTLLSLAWCPAASDLASAGEFRFVVEDLPDDTATWSPGKVLIHRETDLKGGLVFVLENPTHRTHVFLVDGLFEQVVDETGGATAKPLRVTVAQEESVRIQIRTAQFEGIHAQGEKEEHRFFCPLHKADADLGGTIHVVP